MSGIFFQIRDVVRQLALKYSGIGPKEQVLDRVLGPEWQELYSAPRKPTQLSFLDSQEERERELSFPAIEVWVQQRLAGIFPFASDPLPILSLNGRQIFSLFLAISNPSAKAIDLAKHFIKHVNINYGPAASRQTSGL